MLRALHIGFALICAALVSQLPAYHNQYLQRIGGALDEISAQVTGLDERAMAAGVDRYDYIRRFQDNDDGVIQSEGKAMIALLQRQKRLTEAQARLRDAPWYMIAIEIAFHLEPDIARNTLTDFTPTLPLSVSGGAHAFLGFFFGYLIPAGIRSLFPRKVIKQA